MLAKAPVRVVRFHTRLMSITGPKQEPKPAQALDTSPMMEAFSSSAIKSAMSATTATARREISSKLFYAVLADFQTQFTNGYDYSTEPPLHVSSFMAPAYSNMALGISYKANDNYSCFLSPITLRTTMVLDDVLANAGAYGMKDGNHFLFEPGAYFVANGQQKIMENVVLTSRLDLFTPYNNDFGNIDVNWDLAANCHINKFLTATVSTTLRYFEREIPKIQFRQMLGLGLSYTFATR